MSKLDPKAIVEGFNSLNPTDAAFKASKPTSIVPWREFVFVCNRMNDGLCYDWVQIPISYQALDQKLLYEEGHASGICKIGNDNLEKRVLEELGGKKICYNVSEITSRSIYAWDDAACQYYFSVTEGEGQFHWTSNNTELSKAFRDIEKLFKNKKPEGRAYVLVPCQGGLTTKSIGMGAVPLITDNYNKEVVEGFNSIVKDISSPNPLGRLAIFDGPPGTGKTYLIRALLSSLPDTKFLLLPSNMADSLTGPELLQALISESECMEQSQGVDLIKEPPKKTMVLVIEDADKCLSCRKSDNISAISAILNLSDGIIGNLLDLRIVCTTNAEVQEIDEALMRTGRLSARVEVNLLDVEHAKTIYARVGGEKEQVWDQKYYSLSDIYAMAKGKEIGAVVEGRRSCKAKVGFVA